MAENAFKADWPSFALGFNTGKSKGGSGGGMELNIAYGDTPPEDTSKLWVKTSKPAGADVLSYDRIAEEGYMPVSFCNGETAVIDGKIYIVSPGIANTNAQGNGHIYCYDTKTGEFEDLGFRVSQGNRLITAWAYNKRIYYVGYGQNSTKIFSYYDTIEKKSHSVNDTLDTYRYGMGCGVVNNKVYLLGGSNDGYYNATNRILCFDPETEELTKMTATLPNKNSNMGCVTYGSKIFMFGGASSNNSRKYIDCYDVDKNAASSVGSLPKSLRNVVCGICDDTAYIMYGIGASASSSSVDYNENIYAFNVLTYGIEELPIKNIGSNDRPAFATVDGLYLFGGSFVVGNTASAYIRKFKFAPDTRENYITVETADGGSPVTIVDGASKIRCNVRDVFKADKDGKINQVEAFVNKNGEWEKI